MSHSVIPGLDSRRSRFTLGRSLSRLMLVVGLWASMAIAAAATDRPLWPADSEVVAQDVIAQEQLAQERLAQRLVAELPSSSVPLEATPPLDEPLRSLVLRGRQLLKQRDYKGAIAQYEQALAKEPAIPAAWYGRMVAQKELGQAKSAVFSYYSYSEASRLVGNLDIALAGFEWFEQRRPNFVDAVLSKGLTLDQMGRQEAARKSYARAIAIDPENHRSWELQGDMLARLEAFEEAAASYKQWVKLQPDSPEARWSYGQALIETARLPEALEQYQQLAALAPKSARPQQRQGWILLQLGEFQQAVQQYDKAIALKPDSAVSWQGKGYALAQLGQYEAALEAMEQSLQLDDQDSRSWQQQAEILEKLGRLKEAKDSLRQVDILRGVEVLS